MNGRIIVAALAVLALAGEARAADEPDAVDLALEFGDCAALYFAYADLGEETGQHPDDLELARGLARGAELAALLLLGLPDFQTAEAYVRDQVESNRVQWRARLRGGSPEPHRRLQRCIELNGLQARLVHQFRKDSLTR
jgi:hypothetical protein